MSRVIALIPARSGSKGVPDKNVRTLLDRPLIQYTIAACLRSRLIDRVIVSTDSEHYAAVARGLGAEAPFLRPAEISGDSSTDHEFIAHAIAWLDSHGDCPVFIVHMRPTTPLRDPALIDDAITGFMGHPEATSLRSVHEMSESAYKAFEIGANGWFVRLGTNDSALDSANNARQKFPKTYAANGYVDVLRSDFVRQSGSIHGNRVLPFITPPVVEVDSPEDFDLLEFQALRNSGIINKLFSEK
jgi:N-acylneuraminate cytidylyltransferase